ncbi:guanylate cyclase 32E-like [Diprion similis]|uniref:guanylate cyclase 32E-like n=1 Tax=Diprion similis TaxID=362088 RepID=UPI001EF7A204|nr:guanylate cyclase 32E-like [Diprion similis]
MTFYPLRLLYLSMFIFVPLLAKDIGANHTRKFEKCSRTSFASGAQGYRFLYDYLTGSGLHSFNKSLTIGFLGSYGRSQVVLGALPLAIATVNSDPNLLPGIELKFLAADIGRSNADSLAALGIRIMTEMRDSGTVAFIGPDDSCRSEALVAAAWNLPLISYKCEDPEVSDSRVYYTFARTLPPTSKISKSVVALLRAFSWTKIVVVCETRPAWSEKLKDYLQNYGITVMDTFTVNDYIPIFESKLDDIVTATYLRTRVYLFVGEHIALVDFVKCLQKRRLLYTGDYIIVSVDDKIYDPQRRIDITQRNYIDPYLPNRNMSEDVKFGFRSVLKLTPTHVINPNFKEVCERIKNYSVKPPFCVPYHSEIFKTIAMPIQAAYLYDAVMIYARAATELLAEGEDPRNGSAILSKIRNRSYHSLQGYDVFIDENGDAEGNFTVVSLLDDEDTNGTVKSLSMQPVGYFQYSHNDTGGIPRFRYINPKREIQWVGPEPPRAEPECGFTGELCRDDFDEELEDPSSNINDWRDWRLQVALLAATALVVVAAVFAFKHYRYEQKLACILWKIDLKDLTMIPSDVADSCNEKSVVYLGEPGCTPKAHTRVALYRESIVEVKPIYKKTVDMTRTIRKELKQIREIRHENLIPFMGAVVEPGAIFIVTGYCARGSLRDLLQNDDLRLDPMFASSLVADLLRGMIYLHDSDIISHGNLRSSNCLVDSRWVLQISDFGLHEFKSGQEEPDHEKKELQRMLYRAPELLRSGAPPARGSQKGDVYSFSLVLYEIMTRRFPWDDTLLTHSEIVENIKKGRRLRPTLSYVKGVSDYIIRCIESCWHEEPEVRPDMKLVSVVLKPMQAGLKANIFDNMLAIMEKYACNLEGLIQQRTNELVEEKKKTDALLHRMLPKTVAEALKRGDPVEAESFDSVTIYFSDIVGFTELSAESTPLQVITLLNELYTCCDYIISHYDVYKVETIGDAYMVVSGLPVRNGDKHAGEIASMALHLLRRISRFELPHKPGESLKIRIGIHSGHCVAGVVGLKMPRYCLFGDTVNTASRMESSGSPLRIHMSEDAWKLLQKLGGYQAEERGMVEIKGKGVMKTYWLVGEDPLCRQNRIFESNSHFHHSHYGSLCSLSSERLTETPDLLRRTIGAEFLDVDTIDLGGFRFTRRELHSRALRVCSHQNSQELIYHGAAGRSHRSAPAITLTDRMTNY